MNTTSYPRALLRQIARHDQPLLNEPTFDGTLASAVLAYAHQRSCDGLKPDSVRGIAMYPGAALLAHAEPKERLDAFTLPRVKRFIREVRGRYSPVTVKGKHLQLLRLLLTSHGLADPTREAKRDMRSLLKGTFLPPPAIREDELGTLLQRVEDYPANLPSRKRDLALFRLLAFCAVRTFELCRVQIESDLYLAVPSIIIRQAKDRAHPREIPLTADLANDVRTLAAYRTHGPLILGGTRWVNSRLETWKARLNEPRLNQRHLRRSCATNLDRSGAPITVVRDILGHKRDSAETLKYLVSDSDVTRREIMRLQHRSSPAS